MSRTGRSAGTFSCFEDWLGTPLFRRQNRRVELTDPGRAYLSEVGAALDRIAVATAQHAGRRRGQLLRVNATTTLTLRWLIPRLSAFQMANPPIEVRLTTSNETVTALGSEFDVIIRQAAGDVPGCAVAWVLPLYRIPVCSPSLLVASPISSVEDLAGHTLLYSASRPTVWDDWLSLAGVPTFVPKRSFIFEHNYQALQGALDGLGVAVGSSALIENDLADARLVRPFAGPKLPVDGYRAYVPETKIGDPAVKVFCDWLGQITEAAGGADKTSTAPIRP
jgi:LysR family transcriptional regulator, glycine cleavage system transcriptional activator